MAIHDIVFGGILEVSHDAEGDIVVRLDTEGTVRLHPGDERARALASVLGDFRRHQLPAWLEIDASGYITRTRLPLIVRVDAITETPSGDAEVTFEHAQGRYTVRKDDHRVLEALRAAPKTQWLAVTASAGFEILGVHHWRSPYDSPVVQASAAEASLESPWTSVSMSRAQELFDLCVAPTCEPNTTPPSCIPFLYPDDGCWARAHEMCRLLIAEGAEPRKIWLKGKLIVPTKNNPKCAVRWGWHVAPTVRVRTNGSPSSEEIHAIDPSLFPAPVPVATWQGVQGDPAATLTPSSASIYYLWDFVVDPTYTMTNTDLATYRTALKNRSANDGPPPYANCP